MEKIDVRIFDRDYRLAVGPDEKAGLIAAAALVDETMRSVRDENRLTQLIASPWGPRCVWPRP
jgi:cell division protein ZapA